MNINEIVRQFEAARSVTPRSAIQAAVAQREEVTPALLAILERVIEDQESLESDSFAHWIAIVLLAEFRETRAYPLVVKLMSLPQEEVEGLFGDFVTEHLHRVLASISGGDTSGIRALIENPQCGEFVRWAAIDSLVILVSNGLADRDEIISYFATLFRGGLEREYSAVWDGLTAAAVSLYPEELSDDIKRAYADELVDPVSVEFEEVAEALSLGREAVLARTGSSEFHRMIDSALQEIPSWWWFPDERPGDEWIPALADRPPSPPVQRIVKKVGRNEPCPCGSGKKYKKCCAQ